MFRAVLAARGLTKAAVKRALRSREGLNAPLLSVLRTPLLSLLHTPLLSLLRTTLLSLLHAPILSLLHTPLLSLLRTTLLSLLHAPILSLPAYAQESLFGASTTITLLSSSSLRCICKLVLMTTLHYCSYSCHDGYLCSSCHIYYAINFCMYICSLCELARSFRLPAPCHREVLCCRTRLARRSYSGGLRGQ